MKYITLFVIICYLLFGCANSVAKQKGQATDAPDSHAYTTETISEEESFYTWSTLPTDNSIPFHTSDSESYTPWINDFTIDLPRVPNKETALAFAEAALMGYQYQYIYTKLYLCSITYYEKHDIWTVAYVWEPHCPGATIEIAIKGQTGEIVSMWLGE